MIKNEPKFKLMSIFAYLSFTLGFIMFLVVLHLISIQTVGGVSSVISKTFIIFLIIFRAYLTFSFVFLVIHLLKWLTWQVSTPKWVKREGRQ